MLNSRATNNLMSIATQVEQLKLFHHGCLKLLDSIQKEICKDKLQSTEFPEMDLPSGYGFELFGQWFSAITGKGIFVNVLREFSELDPQFPDRFAQRLQYIGRSRSYIARKIEDLYPENIKLNKYHAAFASGWYVGTNESNQKKKKILKIACEVMDIRFGVDLRIKMP